jgi:hypothetical protein
MQLVSNNQRARLNTVLLSRRPLHEAVVKKDLESLQELLQKEKEEREAGEGIDYDPVRKGFVPLP